MLLYYSKLPRPVFYTADVPLEHGSNVAIMESKKRGSVFVLLSPKNEVECDLLAACHVLGTG
jgi:hypothetical protein